MAKNLIKNYVIITTRKGGCGLEEKDETLYNFNEIRVLPNGDIRIECDGRFYYFQTYESHIKEVKWIN